jgi:hypothetical protein
MGFRYFFAILLYGALGVSRVNARDVVSIIQDFYILDVIHGSTGPDYLKQYDGPLMLRGVQIDWLGYADTAFEHPDPRTPDEHYSQPFTGSVGFVAYPWGSNNFVWASDHRDYSGIADCTQNECSARVAGGGT